jgi:DNA-binding NtrC family response regulator
VQHFLLEAARQYGTRARSISDGALRALQAYEWPGNVRELRNVVERAVLFSRGSQITPDELPATLRGDREEDGRRRVAQVRSLHEAVEQAETEAILAALAATEGRRAEAAELLGISRKTLWEKIKLHEISVG